MSTQQKASFDHTGSSFDSFLEEEGILDEVDAVAAKRVSAWQLDLTAQADAREGIRQGLEDVKNGRTRPIREFFAEFEAAHPCLKRESK
jgi:hypothetical protein